MNYLQSSVAEWLSLLRLAEYTSSLERQGYANIDSITDITWEDLEDIGITKLGTDRFCVLHILRTVSVTWLSGTLHSLNLYRLSNGLDRI